MMGQGGAEEPAPKPEAQPIAAEALAVVQQIETAQPGPPKAPAADPAAPLKPDAAPSALVF